ncbi:hypothetical protein QEN42_21140 [Gordonia alkanivorans]|uniref:hypothetical protein n=1 Tax=Gordonia alkanivorans TaxID=84096 RepID=UPI00244A9FE3|nr:hypothetical protein [Gordonia alkanivorans]MDH3052340.1 hypothetical protein [Gordonia alkanivorans]
MIGELSAAAFGARAAAVLTAVDDLAVAAQAALDGEPSVESLSAPEISACRAQIVLGD